MLLLYGSVGEVEVFGDYSLYQRTTTAVDRLLTLDQREQPVVNCHQLQLLTLIEKLLQFTLKL